MKTKETDTSHTSLLNECILFSAKSFFNSNGYLNNQKSSDGTQVISKSLSYFPVNIIHTVNNLNIDLDLSDKST